MAAEDLLQELGVDLGRVFLDQFVQQYPAVRLKQEIKKLEIFQCKPFSHTQLICKNSFEIRIFHKHFTDVYMASVLLVSV